MKACAYCRRPLPSEHVKLEIVGGGTIVNAPTPPPALFCRLACVAPWTAARVAEANRKMRRQTN